MDKLTNFFKTGSFEPEVVLTYASTSLFLAKVIGIYLIIVGLYCLIRFDSMKAVAEEYIKNRAFPMITGIIAIVLGLLIVVSHNIWVWDWPLIITLIGYLALLKGLARLFIPEIEKGWAGLLSNIPFLVINGVFWILVGLYLTYQGFYAM